VSLCQWLVLLVAAQRLGEVAWARRNERRLRAAGGVEIGARHYPLFFVLHGSWLAALWLLVPADAPVIWPLLVLFALLQAARVWVIASLGWYWTTRIISVPDAPLVVRGPYRWLKHPNYLVVAGEIAVLPLAFGAWRVALVYSVLNGLLLWHRIRVEDAALAPRRAMGRDLCARGTDCRERRQPRSTTLEHWPPSGR
jgi:methyltransferase